MSFFTGSSYSVGMSLIGLNSNLAVMYKSIERLSSGLRINSASDDPAGLVISEQFRTQIASLNQEIDNISSSINKYQTVSSTVSGLRSQLTGLRSLAIGAANEAGNSEGAQEAFAAAAEDIVDAYNSTVKNAQYNGAKTLDGSEQSLADVSGLADIDLSTPEAAAASIEHIDEAIAELDSVQIELGSTQQNELESQQASLEVTRQNLIAAESQIRDIDFAQEYSNYIANMIRTQATMSMIVHAALIGSSVVSLLDS